MSTWGGRRRTAAMLSSAVVGVPVLLAIAATPALAATGSITSPGNGSTYFANDPVSITADIRRGVVNDAGKVALSLTPPGGSAREVASSSGANSKSASFTFTPSCPNYPGVSCDGKTAANGTYTIKLSGNGVNDTRTFSLKVAPARPSGVQAEATGDRQITVSWNFGAEPDLLSYDVFTTEGQLLTTVPADKNVFILDFGPSGYGGQHGYQIRAARRSCPTCTTDPLVSPMSSTASATLVEPEPSPTPSPEPTDDPNVGGGGGEPDPSATPTPNATDDDGFGSGGGGGTGTNGGGTGTNGGGAGGGSDDGFNSGTGATTPHVASQKRAFGVVFKDFAPKLGAPKLPPLPQFAPPPEEEGAFDTELGYGEHYEDIAVGETAGTVREFVDTLVSTVFEGTRLWTSIAASLVMLLGAGHLRLWLNSAPKD